MALAIGRGYRLQETGYWLLVSSSNNNSKYVAKKVKCKWGCRTTKSFAFLIKVFGGKAKLLECPASF